MIVLMMLLGDTSEAATLQAIADPRIAVIF